MLYSWLPETWSSFAFAFAVCPFRSRNTLALPVRVILWRTTIMVCNVARRICLWPRGYRSVVFVRYHALLRACKFDSDRKRRTNTQTRSHRLGNCRQAGSISQPGIERSQRALCRRARGKHAARITRIQSLRHFTWRKWLNLIGNVHNTHDNSTYTACNIMFLVCMCAYVCLCAYDMRIE